VVITEVVQFFILSIASFAVGIIAMRKVAPEMLHRWVPAGWDNIFFGWHLNLDWSTLLPAAGAKIADDRYELFGFFVMMLLFKGIPISAAGPPRTTICSASFPRRIPAKPHDERMGQHRAHPSALFSRHRAHRAGRRLLQSQPGRHGKQTGLRAGAAYGAWTICPGCLLGFLIAGLLAAFMSNFAATVNAAPPYFVTISISASSIRTRSPRPMSALLISPPLPLWWSAS